MFVGGSVEGSRPTVLYGEQIRPGSWVSVDIQASLIQKCFIIFSYISIVLILPFIC